METKSPPETKGTLSFKEIMSPITDALETNKVTVEECIGAIVREMREAVKYLLIDKKPVAIIDYASRSRAAESLLAFMGYPRPTKNVVETTGTINIGLKRYDDMFPDEIRAEIAALDKLIEELETIRS